MEISLFKERSFLEWNHLMPISVYFYNGQKPIATLYFVITDEIMGLKISGAPLVEGAPPVGGAPPLGPKWSGLYKDCY